MNKNFYREIIPEKIIFPGHIVIKILELRIIIFNILIEGDCADLNKIFTLNLKKIYFAGCKGRNIKYARISAKIN